jgi:anti-anti-sigma factor
MTAIRKDAPQPPLPVPAPRPPAEATDLRVDVLSTAPLVVGVSGEIDIASAPKLREELLSALRRHGTRLALDLDGVTFMDCAGIDVLLAARRHARLEGGWVRVARASRHVRNILMLTGLHREFALADSETTHPLATTGEQFRQDRAFQERPVRLTLRARRRCSADGHDVDSVDLFRLLLHAHLDATHQRLDLSTAQAIFDVNPGDNPYLTRADEGEEEFANGGHTGVPKEDGSYLLLVSGPEWLGEAGNVVALRPCGGPRPGADQEVVAALDEPEADADQYQRDEHRGHSLGYGRPGDLIQGQGGKRDHVSGD